MIPYAAHIERGIQGIHRSQQPVMRDGLGRHARHEGGFRRNRRAKASCFSSRHKRVKAQVSPKVWADSAAGEGARLVARISVCRSKRRKR